MILQTTSSRGQNIRSGPSLEFTAIGAAYQADAITLERFANSEWAEVTLRTVRGFMMRSYLREIVEVVAPMGHALVGIDGPAPKWSWADGVNYDLIRTARVEAVKLLCADDADGEIIANLKAINPAMFVMARVYAQITSKQRGDEVMSEFVQVIERQYAAGVRHFEVGNEPNLFNGAMGSLEGMGIAWHDGYEFANWWLSAADYLRSRFPEILLGFSAMSPGAALPGFRYDPEQMMVESAAAVQSADWIAQHVYWEADHVTGALAEVEAFARRFPHKVVLVTEFGNASPYISMEQKADQYIDFYDRAKLLPKNLGALICFTLVGENFPGWQWRDTNVAKILGSRT
jgi:hypothetical protein